MLNLSRLPVLQRLFVQFEPELDPDYLLQFAQHRDDPPFIPEPYTIVEELSESEDGPISSNDSSYAVELSKRMPALEHVDVVFVADAQWLTECLKRGREHVMSTRFTRACWKMKLLRAFVVLRDKDRGLRRRHAVDFDQSNGREEIQL
jgi:hypothetical protein